MSGPTDATASDSRPSHDTIKDDDSNTEQRGERSAGNRALAWCKEYPIEYLRRYGLGQMIPADRQILKGRFRRIGIGLSIIGLLWLAGFGYVVLYSRLNKIDSKGIAFRSAASSDAGLVVIVPGWTRQPDAMTEVAEVVASLPEQQFGKPAIQIAGYNSGRFSNEDLDQLGRTLAKNIGKMHAETGGKVILIGHSLGGLLVRSAFLRGVEKKQPWAEKVERIVLLAAPNRGTTATEKSRALWFADTLARSYGVGRMIQSTYRGAPFIVNLRLNWIKTFRQLDRPPAVVQLLGTRDSVVSSSDSVDVLQFPNALEISLPNSTHDSITRAAQCGDALEELMLAEIEPDLDRDDSGFGDALPSEGVSIKLLVVHGIRDYGDRFNQISQAVESYAAQNNIHLRAVAPRYQYFSALQFLNPISREYKVYEFADLYTELYAKPPVGAPIHFVGHSFGTFLMGESTKKYGTIKFDRVYLAGSVLHEKFFADNNHLLGQQVQHVRNDIATADWPVGVLCAGIDDLGIAQNVGTAGFTGFSHITSDRCEEIRYFNGGHGEALDPINHKTIASWLLEDHVPPEQDLRDAKAYLKDSQVLVDQRPWLWGQLERASAAIFLGIICLIGYLVLFGRQPLFALCEVTFVLWFLNVL